MSAVSTISIKNFLDAANYIHPTQTILMRGRHGIGKSDLAYQLARIWGLDTVIERRIAQLSEGDMIGLPDRESFHSYELDGKNVKKRITSFLPTDWFVLAESKPCLIFLDEINRGTPEVQQACFQFVEKGELNGRKIHPDSRVVAAVNFSREYNVTPMGFAFLDRFSIFDIEPTKSDWITWANSSRVVSSDDSPHKKALREACPTNIHPIITEFIRQCNTDHFEILPEKQAAMDSHEITPSRRSWARVSDHLSYTPGQKDALIHMANNQAVYDIARSIVGPDAARALQKFVTSTNKNVTPEQIVTDFASVESIVKILSPEEQTSLVDKLKDYLDRKADKLSEGQAKNIASFMKALPDEITLTVWAAISTSGVEKVAAVHPHVINHMLEIFAKSKIGDQIPELRKAVGLSADGLTKLPDTDTDTDTE